MKISNASNSVYSAKILYYFTKRGDMVHLFCRKKILIFEKQTSKKSYEKALYTWFHNGFIMLKLFHK